MRSLPLLALLGCGTGEAPTDLDTHESDPTDSSMEPTTDGSTELSSTGDEIWAPAPGLTWQWQLQAAVDTTLDVMAYDIDLFDPPDDVFETLHADSRIVICYFSAGSREDWRTDANQFDPTDYANPLGGWPGEHWLDTRSASVRAIMQTRLDLARDRGCDAVEPDNVDGYANDSGFPLTRADGLDYLNFLADEAHARGLSIGLKNALEQVDDTVDRFDWALNEECVSYAECDALQPFLDAGKAVLHVEYVDQPAQGPTRAKQVCADPSRTGFSTLIKTWDLDAWNLTCG